MSIDPSAGPALRVQLAARGGVRAGAFTARSAQASFHRSTIRDPYDNCFPPTHNESPTTHYCTVQHHVPSVSAMLERLAAQGRLYSPPLTTESPTTHYCTVQHHVPIDPYAERMPRADCSSNTIRDSISRVSPSLRGPRFAPALRHARRPCALTRGRPAVPRQPGTGRSRRTARRAALAPAVLR